MTNEPNRRRFLQASLAATTALMAAPRSVLAEEKNAFSFALLGDLHFDKLEHHDFGWLERNKPSDLSQIKNYSKLTAEIMPQLFARLSTCVSQLQAASAQVPFVLQVGDLVEGLCGTEELAARQNREALEFVRDSKLGLPFLFTKGNHDVTGDGANQAFASVFQPYLREQASGFAGGGRLANACYAIQHGNALFCFFDAYDRESLEWLEATLAKRTARHCFVVVHPPVVPYGARATWHLYSSAKDRARRDKLLGMLGNENALVLSGHLHKYNTITRTTPGGGRFVQVAVSSVVKALDAKPKDHLSGVEAYNGDQIQVEPTFSPETAQERRAIYEAERPLVKSFEYADLAGYAVVTVSDDAVKLAMHAGTGEQAWATADLMRLLTA